MIALRDFLLSGNQIDYDGFAKALVNGGYHCEICLKKLPVEGKPGKCAECSAIYDSPLEARHCFLIRCPHCGCITDVPENHPAWTDDGTYGQICVCRSDFVFRALGCLFISPPLERVVAK